MPSFSLARRCRWRRGSVRANTRNHSGSRDRPTRRCPRPPRSKRESSRSSAFFACQSVWAWRTTPDGNRFTVRFASLGILAVGAAIARRNRIAVRASFRMPQKCADALVELRADDVLKLAGLVVGFGIFNREGVPEESLGEAVAADGVAGAAAAAIGELHF